MTARGWRDKTRVAWMLRGDSPVVPAKDFKRRMVVEIDGAPHMIEQITVQTPSARGAATLYKIKARNLKTRNRVEREARKHQRNVETTLKRNRNEVEQRVRRALDEQTSRAQDLVGQVVVALERAIRPDRSCPALLRGHRARLRSR